MTSGRRPPKTSNATTATTIISLRPMLRKASGDHLRAPRSTTLECCQLMISPVRDVQLEAGLVQAHAFVVRRAELDLQVSRRTRTPAWRATSRRRAGTGRPRRWSAPAPHPSGGWSAGRWPRVVPDDGRTAREQIVTGDDDPVGPQAEGRGPRHLPGLPACCCRTWSRSSVRKVVGVITTPRHHTKKRSRMRGSFSSRRISTASVLAVGLQLLRAVCADGQDEIVRPDLASVRPADPNVACALAADARLPGGAS